MDKKAKRKLIDSCQSLIPMEDIVSGVIVTKDKRLVRIIEVKPVPFFLKSPSDQNRIYESFRVLLKSAPSELQFKSVTLPVSLAPQISLLRMNMENETSKDCLKADEEYEKRLLESEGNGVTRRFFIIFSYEPGDRRETLEKSIVEINRISSRISRALRECGNETARRNGITTTRDTIEILFTLLNRSRIRGRMFDERLQEVTARYQEASGGESIYIPPKDIVAPSRVSFLSPRYMETDGTYYSYAYIPSGGYPATVIPGWLSIFTNSIEGVDTDIFLTRMNRAEVMSSIRRNINYSQVAAEDSMSNTDSRERSTSAYASGVYLRDGLSAGEDFHYMSTLVTVTGKSLDEVESRMAELKKNAVEDGIGLRVLRNGCEKAFASTMPFCQLDRGIREKSRRNVLTEGAASLYPFTSYEIRDDEGIYFGDDLQTGSLVLVDIFNRSRFNSANVFISGQSGAGKTYSLLLMALRMRIMHIPVMILAPEKEDEFRRVCTGIGGQFIELGAGSESCINIMDIRMEDSRGSENRRLLDGSAASTSMLSEKARSIRSFLSLHIPDMNAEEKQLLDDAIIATYAKFGITRDNSSLFEDEEHTRYRKMPVLKDLQDTLRETDGARRIANIMNYFTTGSGQSFNRQTNVDLDNEFIVFGLEHLSEETMAMGIYLAMDFCWSKIREDKTRKKALFVDEWWKWASHRISAEYSEQIARTIRAYNGSMVLATQQLSDIFAIDEGKYGTAVLNNCPIRILMKTEDLDAAKVQEIVGLNDNEKGRLVRLERGQALFISSESRLTLKFVAGSKEHSLITTDGNDIRRIIEENRRQEEQRKLLERIGQADVLDGIVMTSREFIRADIEGGAIEEVMATGPLMEGDWL